MKRRAIEFFTILILLWDGCLTRPRLRQDAQAHKSYLLTKYSISLIRSELNLVIPDNANASACIVNASACIVNASACI
ncbi:MAG: hypothetical protein ACYTX0_03735, partial [Nostoc sp.]